MESGHTPKNLDSINKQPLSPDEIEAGLVELGADETVGDITDVDVNNAFRNMELDKAGEVRNDVVKMMGGIPRFTDLEVDNALQIYDGVLPPPSLGNLDEDIPLTVGFDENASDHLPSPPSSPSERLDNTIPLITGIPDEEELDGLGEDMKKAA